MPFIFAKTDITMRIIVKEYVTTAFNYVVTISDFFI